MTAGKAERSNRNAESAATGPFQRSAFLFPLALAALGALLVLLLSQLPAAHAVDVGGHDAAYTQGFYDPEPAGVPPLAGGDGSARWSRPSAALLFPQAGLPGAVTVRLRGWRESGPPPEVALLLNGETELARFRATGDWEERTVPVTGGWRKATDFFVEVRSTPAALADGREVGVLVDRASYRVGPGLVVPYPAQLAYGAAAGLLLALLLRPAPGERRGRGALLAPALGLAAYGLAWLLLYRLQPPLYPYPLRALPPLTVLALGAALAVRDGPRLAARAPWLVGAALPAAVIAAWTAATLLAAQGHVTLARPGVENDFRVFATRETLAQVLSADGFYNLGYPLLLWLARPLFDGNAFLAGRLVAALAGAATLAGGYWLARALLPPGPALAALVALALSALVAQYGLYVGSDMPFAAALALCVAAVVAAGGGDRGGGGDTGRRGHGEGGTRGQGERGALALAVVGGVFGGVAFLIRHPGLLLLPWGALALLALRWRGGEPWGRRLAAPLAFCLAFLVAMAPQVAVNTAQAGRPLYNQQAKNIWLAVYGGTDWGRWDEAPNEITLAEVVLRDPARFLANWWGNVVGYTGSGAEDTSEFGRAIQLRLLGWPANWLAVAGLLGWMYLGVQKATRRPGMSGAAEPTRADPHRGLRRFLALLALVALYVAAVSTGFTLQRFFLPLAAVYAAAAGWALWRLAGGGRALLGVTLALAVVLWGGRGAGAGYVLATQPADEVAAVRLVQAQLPPGEPLAARISARVPLDKYSAVAHLFSPWPAGADTDREVTPADLADLAGRGVRYLLWDEAAGPPPAPAALVASSGRYGLYRIE
jgi:4-amino-4-deoxy-L-arabinose transferase-like glycosyltransferase